jgi:hypothetical protein
MFFNEKSMFEEDLAFDGPKADDLFINMIQKATENSLTFEKSEIDRIKETSLEDLSASLTLALNFINKTSSSPPRNKP